MKPTLEDILDDIHAAERELQKYEKKYRVRSDSFYECFMAGLIEDAGNFDFQKWAGYCESKHDLEQLYKELVSTQKLARERSETLIADDVVAG
jgi:hypothetical protein